jgi:1-acyl-sn-glycerol-3-phosphate acyltransferase
LRELSGGNSSSLSAGWSSSTDKQPLRSLARAATKLPGPGSIIVSSYTSPLDAIYLAAIFDPIFTASYPTTRLVERVSLPLFLWRYFTGPILRPAEPNALVSLPDLLAQNPNRTVLMFPEATPTNGRGILRFTPALASAPPKTKIFPISLKYSPADVTTPVPGAYVKFLWSLLSRPTHCIRVRIAETIYNDETRRPEEESSDTVEEEEGLGGVCDRGSEALARIGRIKRLNLGVKEKIGFVQAWKRRNRLMG